MVNALPQVETSLPKELQGLTVQQLKDVHDALGVLIESGLSKVASVTELCSKVDASLTLPELSLKTEYTDMCSWARTRALWREVEHPDTAKFCKLDSAPEIDATQDQEKLNKEQEEEKSAALASDETENQQIHQQLKTTMVKHTRRLYPSLKSRWEASGPGSSRGYKERYRIWVESQLAATQDLRLLDNESWKPQALGNGRRVLFQEVAAGCPQHHQAGVRRPRIAPSAQASVPLPATRISQVSSEIITLHLGSSGCNLGAALWQQLCEDHSISSDGTCAKDPVGCFAAHFQETEKGRLVPRAVLVDAQASGLSEAFASKCFAPDDLIEGGLEDGGHLWDKDTCVKLTSATMERIRMQMEKADAPSAFMLTFASLEHAGSALARSLGPKLSVEYGRKGKWAFSLVPSSANNEAREYINSALSFNSLVEHLDLVTFADSLALQTTYDYRLSTGNKLMAQVMSACTRPQRFCPTSGVEGSRCCTIQSSLTSLVPYPRIHFTTPSIANQGDDVVSKALENNNLCTYVNTGTDTSTHKNVALAVFGRGLDAPQVTAAVAKHKLSRDCVFVDWSPVGFTCGCHCDPAAPNSREAVVICNSTHLKNVFESWSIKMDEVMAGNKDELALYVEKGELEEDAFTEIREELSSILMDYGEVNIPTNTGEGEEEGE